MSTAVDMEPKINFGDVTLGVFLGHSLTDNRSSGVLIRIQTDGIVSTDMAVTYRLRLAGPCIPGRG